MKHTVKTFFRRLGGMSVRRMYGNAAAEARESGRGTLSVLFDMLWCVVRYGVGYLDYHVFGFGAIRGKKRAAFMTMNDNLALVRRLNDPECYRFFKDKLVFCERFSDFLGRAWLNLRGLGERELRSFCKGRDAVFVKRTESFGGQGVERVELSEDTDYARLFERLSANGQWLVEEAVVQHPQMSLLCPSCVNTVRIVTLLSGGEAHFLYALLRMGFGDSSVDNISSGGMYTRVVEGGRLDRPAFCDKTGLYYDEHPTTGVRFDGFVVPYFDEAVELCRRAALVEPKVGYVGWDAAITPQGPLLIEGNHIPSYDMAQNHMFIDGETGLLPRVEEIIGQKLR